MSHEQQFHEHECSACGNRMCGHQSDAADKYAEYKNQAIAKALLIGAELERGDIVAHLDREANASKAPQNTVAWALAREIENGEHHGEH